MPSVRSSREPELTVPESDSATPPANDHLLALDGVRGIAILVVLVHNTAFIAHGVTGLPLKAITAITATGWTGVELFFVLSGFLITGILVDALGSPAFFRTFYIRRTLRIFPLYYGVLAIALFVVPAIANVPEWRAIAWKNQWWYWTYLDNWGSIFGHGIPGLPHFWSLAVEEQFYLMWPLLVFATPRRGLIALCIAVVAATPLIRLALMTSGLSSDAAYMFTVARWDALAAGALLAISLRSDAGRARLRRGMPWITAGAVTGLLAIIGIEHGFHSDDLSVAVAGQSFFALASAGLIYACVAPVSRSAHSVRRAMSGRTLRFFGKYRYAIYVFHVPFHSVLAYYVTDSVDSGGTAARIAKLAAYIAVVLVLSTLAALASWRLIEKPCLDLKDRLAPRRVTAREPAPIRTQGSTIHAP